MPANVENMVYVGEKPWHGLGVEVGDLMTLDQAYDFTLPDGSKLMNWKVREQGLFVANPETNESMRVPGYKAIVRDSDNKVLSVMGQNYQTFQNEEMVDFLKAVLGNKAEVASVETAGVLAGGKRVWMLSRLNGVIRVPTAPDDVIEKYLLSFTSHDGSLAHSVLGTSVRVVCQNTLEAARSSAKQGIKVRHTANMAEAVKEAQKVLKLVVNQFDAFEKEVTVLATSKFSEAQMKALAAKLFPAKQPQKNGVIDMAAEAQVSKRSEMFREKLLDLFENGRGQTAAVRGTAWAALNATSEFCDHWRMTRVTGLAEGQERDESAVRESRLNSIWFGASRDFKAEARQYIHAAIAA